MLKALDTAALSWLTHLCSVTKRSGQCLWCGVVVPTFKKGGQEGVVQLRFITLLSLPGKVYSKVLERRHWLIIEPQIQEKQRGF